MIPKKETLALLIAHLQRGLVERDTPVKLCLLALLAGEHALLIGPPGTAKSELARRLHGVLEPDAHYFERLLTRFTIPEELFGPFSLKALQEDRYERQTEHYLPHASLAFLDEIFKANSAILNALLTLINERKFDNGTSRHDAPLLCLLGASNELPQGEELAALYDRFLIRYHVTPTSDEGFATLIAQSDFSYEPCDTRLERASLKAIFASLDAVKLSDEIINLIKHLRQKLTALEIHVSDRRWRKIIKLLKVAALTNDHKTVPFFYGWLLQHLLWNEPEQRQIIHDLYIEQIGLITRVDLPEHIERTLKSLEELYESDATSQTQQLARQARELLPLIERGSHRITPVNRQCKNERGELLYLAPENLKRSQERLAQIQFTQAQLYRFADHNGHLIHDNQRLHIQDYCKDPNNWSISGPRVIMTPTRYSQAHIDGRVKRVEEILEQITRRLEQLGAQRHEIAKKIKGNLWIPEDFLSDATRRLDEQIALTREWDQRATKIRRSFKTLPLELEAGGAA